MAHSLLPVCYELKAIKRATNKNILFSQYMRGRTKYSSCITFNYMKGMKSIFYLYRATTQAKYKMEESEIHRFSSKISDFRLKLQEEEFERNKKRNEEGTFLSNP